MLVRVCFLALAAEVEDVSSLEVSRASLTDVDRLRFLQEAISALMAQHVGFLNELLTVLWRLVLHGDALPGELMQVLFILLEAPLAEAKVVAHLAVKAVRSPFNRFLATIASEPHLVVGLLKPAFNLFLQWFSQFPFIHLWIHLFGPFSDLFILNKPHVKLLRLSGLFGLLVFCLVIPFIKGFLHCAIV